MNAAVKPNKTRPKKEAGEDSRALARVLKAIVEGGGRGSLTLVADAVALEVSPFRKRLLRDGAGLDEATIKAVLFVASRKSENFEECPVISAEVVDGYVIEKRQDGEGVVLTWRLE